MDHFKPEPSTINSTQHESDNGQYPNMRPANPSNPKNLHTTLKVMKQKNLKTPLERLSPTDPNYEAQLENIKMPLERLSPTDPDYEVQLEEDVSIENPTQKHPGPLGRETEKVPRKK